MTAAFFDCARPARKCQDFLPIESSVRHGEESGVLRSSLKRNSEAIEIAFVVEASLLEETRVVLIRFRLRSPREELRHKGSPSQFRKVRENHGARISRHSIE